VLQRPAFWFHFSCLTLVVPLLLLLLFAPVVVNSMEWGGSNIRPEATGYGAVYFGLEILKDKGEDIKVRCVDCWFDQWFD
jgi:hypothetical protein